MDILSPILKYKLPLLIGAAFIGGAYITHLYYGNKVAKEFKRGFAAAKKQNARDARLLAKYRDRVIELEIMTKRVLEDAKKVNNHSRINDPNFIKLLDQSR